MKGDMNANNELAGIYDALLSVPGMSENLVKIDLKTSRKNVLLLVQLVERGLNPSIANQTRGLADAVDKEALAEITALVKLFLSKAGLEALSEKLKMLSK